MTKLNNRLLAIFLVLGILFFTVIIYMFLVKEILPGSLTNMKHTVNLTSVKLIKNGYIDTVEIRKLQNTNEETRYNSATNENCTISLLNLADSISYVESLSFNLKTSLPPKAIDFYNNSAIPQPVLKDKYKLVFNCSKTAVVEFPLGNLNTILDLENKEDNLTEKKEYKLTSPDKKLIVFATFTVDQ
jgi:hypothetical protein